MRIQEFATTAVFAEDLRQEASGQVTVVGVLSDNVNFEGDGQLLLPRLCVYVRTLIALNEDPFGPLKVRLESPTGKQVFESVSTKEFLEAESRNSAHQGAPYLTVVSQASMAPFPIHETGRFTVSVEYKGESVLAGFLNIQLANSQSGS